MFRRVLWFLLGAWMMHSGGARLYIAWKLDPHSCRFYEWLERYGYYYPEEDTELNHKVPTKEK